MLVSPADIVARAKATIKECSVTEVNQCLTSDTLLIDIRELAEFRKGHIPGALLAPRGLLEFEIHALVERHGDRPERGTGRPRHRSLLRYRRSFGPGRGNARFDGLSQGQIDGRRHRCLGHRALAGRPTLLKRPARRASRSFHRPRLAVFGNLRMFRTAACWASRSSRCRTGCSAQRYRRCS